MGETLFARRVPFQFLITCSLARYFFKFRCIIYYKISPQNAGIIYIRKNLKKCF